MTDFAGITNAITMDVPKPVMIDSETSPFAEYVIAEIEPGINVYLKKGTREVDDYFKDHPTNQNI